MTEVIVTFQDDQRSYSPGDELRGEVVITTQKPLKCKNVLAKLQCYAHGYGNDTSKDIEKVSLFVGELPAGEHRLAFSFTLPAGPYTYHGHYTNLDWRVQGYVDIPWAIDKKDHEDFMLSAAPVPPHIQEVIPAPPKPHKRSSGLISLATGCILAVITLVTLYLGFTEDSNILCGTLFFGLGAAAFLFFGGHAFLAARVISAPHITVEPWPLRPGQHSVYKLEFTPGTALTLNAIVVELKCHEVVVRGHGTNATTHRHQIYSDIFTLEAGAQYPKGKPVTLTQTIDLPSHLPASFSIPSNSVVWNLSTHIDIPNWPDWKDNHALHVAAPRAEAKQDTSPPHAPGPAW